jgi:hypothetical protein
MEWPARPTTSPPHLTDTTSPPHHLTATTSPPHLTATTSPSLPGLMQQNIQGNWTALGALSALSAVHSVQCSAVHWMHMFIIFQCALQCRY